MSECCECRKKHRDENDRRQLLNRLSRIEGQIRGIRRMVEDDAYCIDILTQVMAVQSALNGFAKEILGDHIKTCVAEDIRNGGEDKTDELLSTLTKLMK